MFAQLIQAGVKAEVFFFDGRIKDDEVPMVLGLSAPGAVYAFDDFKAGPTGKGVANVRKLAPALPNHVLVPPYKPFEGRTALAMLVPLTLQETVAHRGEAMTHDRDAHDRQALFEGETDTGFWRATCPECVEQNEALANLGVLEPSEVETCEAARRGNY
jgi:hypothetical protein